MKPQTLSARLAVSCGVLLLAFGCAAGSQPAGGAAGTPTPATLTTPIPFGRATATPVVPTAAPVVPTAAIQPPTAAPAVPAPGDSTPAAPRSSYRIVAEYPHDMAAWTQGLVYFGQDSFYEGTGATGGPTSLREVALTDGKVRRSISIPDYYGEGIALIGEKIYQLTWQNGVGFIYNRADFSKIGEFRYPPPGRELPAEGWGLTYDGQRLIMSDGTATLYFIDPATMEFTGQVTVQDAGRPVVWLNELEYINGEIYANIWYTDQIARIDPASGQVTGWIDLSGLYPGRPPEAVLNGIAYDAANDRLFVTGKLWPMLYEIDLVAPVSLYAPLISAS